jgi:hypothetical protein
VKHDPRRTTLAAELDRTRWDYAPEKDRRFLLDPIGEIFAKLPWEARAFHLGPMPVAARLVGGQQAVNRVSDLALEPARR